MTMNGNPYIPQPVPMTDGNVGAELDAADPYAGLTACEWQQGSAGDVGHAVRMARFRAASFGLYFTVFGSLFAYLWWHWSQGAPWWFPWIGVAGGGVFAIVGMNVMVRALLDRTPCDMSSALVVSGKALRDSAGMARIMARADYYNPAGGRNNGGSVMTFDMSHVLFASAGQSMWHLVYVDRQSRRAGRGMRALLQLMTTVLQGGIGNMQRNLDDTSNMPFIPAILEVSGDAVRLLIPDTMTRIGHIMAQTVPFCQGHGDNVDQQDSRISYWYRLGWLTDTFPGNDGDVFM
jgi:hypothetical protein